MNRFTVCLVLPFVIWAASKVDTDLAFACFCSSVFYVAWCAVKAINEMHEDTERTKDRRNYWFHQQSSQKPPGDL